LAKKDAGKKKKGDSDGKQQQSRGDAVRAAAAQAIEATAGQAGFTRERAQQLADELVHAAGRFRETLEELRPGGSDELNALRERVAVLEARVEKLEAARSTARRRTTPAKRSTAKRTTAKAPATPPPATPPPATPAPATPPPATPPPASSSSS
jgi:polyhydroxyalkanoate synthesis regulator phasin